MLPVARRVIDRDDTTFRMSVLYAEALVLNPGATLDDLREAVETGENTKRTAQRVLGGAHPIVEVCELSLKNSRAVLAARETPSPRT